MKRNWGHSVKAYSMPPKFFLYIKVESGWYRPYSHKGITINNYVNWPSNFAFARSIYLFYPPIFRKFLCEYGLLNQLPITLSAELLTPYLAEQPVFNYLHGCVRSGVLLRIRIHLQTHDIEYGRLLSMYL